MIAAGWRIGAITKPAAGHDLGGDRAIVREAEGGLLLAIIDVLGHGRDADRVAQVAEDALFQAQWAEANDLLRMLDMELAGSVGAAAGIVTFRDGTTDGRFAGVGNTVFKVLGGNPRTLVSADGVLGQQATVPRPSTVVVQPDETVLMHSDGISSRVDWRGTPEMTTIDVELAAREIMRRFGRAHDDISCIVARPSP